MALNSHKFTHLKQFDYVRQLGSGGFGVVDEMIFVKDGKRYALKHVNVAKVLAMVSGEANAVEKIKQSIFDEGKLLQQIDHPNILKVYGAFLEDSPQEGLVYHIVMELCSGGTLKEKVRVAQKSTGESFSNEQILRWAEQILFALKYLHHGKNKVMHRDIKTDNLFVDDKRDRIILGDFGVAKQVQSSSTDASAHTHIGTRSNMPPEAFIGEGYTFRFDVWSFGVVLFELCTLRLPFAHIADIINSPVPELPANYDQDLRDVILKRMLVKEPKNRSSIRKLCRLPIFVERIEKLELETHDNLVQSKRLLELERDNAYQEIEHLRAGKDSPLENAFKSLVKLNNLSPCKIALKDAPSFVRAMILLPTQLPTVLTVHALGEIGIYEISEHKFNAKIASGLKFDLSSYGYQSIWHACYDAKTDCLYLSVKLTPGLPKHGNSAIACSKRFLNATIVDQNPVLKLEACVVDNGTRMFRGMAVDSDLRLLFACDYTSTPGDISIWKIEDDSDPGKLIRLGNLPIFQAHQASPLFCCIIPELDRPFLLAITTGGSGSSVILYRINVINNSIAADYLNDLKIASITNFVPSEISFDSEKNLVWLADYGSKQIKVFMKSPIKFELLWQSAPFADRISLVTPLWHVEDTKITVLCSHLNADSIFLSD